MDPQTLEASSSTAPPPLDVGVPSSLVFDDNPLDSLLFGTVCVAPSPANVLELWEGGLDRSEDCARAMAAVLVKSPAAINQVRDLESAEHCLRRAIESRIERGGRGVAACWSALDQILELRNQPERAEA